MDHTNENQNKEKSEINKEQETEIQPKIIEKEIEGKSEQKTNLSNASNSIEQTNKNPEVKKF